MRISRRPGRHSTLETAAGRHSSWSPATRSLASIAGGVALSQENRNPESNRVAFPPDHSVADPSPSHPVEIANAGDVQVISQIIDSVVKTYFVSDADDVFRFPYSAIECK